MFIVDKSLKFINRDDKKLLTILKSSNQPLIAAADRPAEPTESYLCSYQNKSKKIETYVMLYLVKSGIRVFYRSDKGEYQADDFSEVEADALEFLESMGFTMDNISFQKMSEAEKDEIFSAMSLFIDPETMKKVDEEVLEPEYISSEELSSGLEEALSEVDFKEMESNLREMESSFKEERDSVAAISAPKQSAEIVQDEENTKAEPKEPEGIGVPLLTGTPATILGKFDEGVKKIARILASF